ncbi:MAG: membrane protein insertion efficiency factor YidD [Pseudomonadota bacterium]
MRTLVLLLLKVYKFAVSPFLGSHCRFQPTCSEYAMESIERFGLRHGTVLTVKRLLRCRPGCKPGYDPVPENENPNQRA